MIKFVSVAVLAFGLACASVSCSSVKNSFSCRDVCQRYADCFKSDYDVDGCESRCKSQADDSSTKQDKLNDCHDCIGDKSCVSDIATCSSSCSDFVP